ncbi:MAG TPA: GDSL-type esterase/lipase family protein [Bacilli bacterium]
MRSSRLIWRATALFSILTALMFAAGFAYAVKDILAPNQAWPKPQKQEHPAQNRLAKAGEYSIVALGDSLTKGTGDVTGKGYVGNTRDLLAKKTGKPVRILANLGINGYETGQLLDDLRTKPNVAYLLKQANIVLFTIGGNDLFQLALKELDLTTAIDPTALYNRMPEALQRMDAIFAALVKINPQAKIMYIGLYNPFADLDETKKSSEAIQKWNADVFQIANRYPNVTVLPTFDLFQTKLSQYLYSDHFHPNETGYARIAERIVQDLP